MSHGCVLPVLEDSPLTACWLQGQSPKPASLVQVECQQGWLFLKVLGGEVISSPLPT